MSKSVLVIDTPESCVMCPLSHYDKYKDKYQCRGINNWKAIENWYSQCIDERDPKPDWCPLSSPPDPIGLKQYVDNGMVNMYGVMYAQGYNDFRRGILKGDN